MKRILCLILLFLMVCLMAMPAMAASDKPVITMQPQSPNNPEYSVAIYMVKATGTNLTATWYMEWMGETYNLSDISNGFEPWEAYAGETYGPVQNDANTFSCHFAGIEDDLNGASIWCVIEDGHYDVISQKARILVGNSNMPPEIVDIPSMLTVEQGAEAEIRCIAKSSDGSQLSYLWYETDTGRLEDMRAVNRGTETSDYMFCDTSVVGTRNYICMVETSAGGIAYSSVVPVTVTEKKVVETVPQEPSVNTPETSAPSQQETPSLAPEADESSQQESTAPTPDTSKSPEQNSPDLAPETNESSQPQTSEPEDTIPTEGPATGTDTKEEQPHKTAFPWWGIVIIAVVAAGAGFGIAVIITKKKA